jgi:hypothetical protein
MSKSKLQVTISGKTQLTKSKQFLADAIHASGRGWPDGFAYAAQSQNGDIYPYRKKPKLLASSGRYAIASGKGYEPVCTTAKMPNWHQTVLSREEYFSSYPVVDDGYGEPVDSEFTPKPAAKPTIEQLAADYRNKLDYANRKQQEADDAKMAIDAALGELVAAGKAIDLVIGIAKQELELVITDWRDLRIGDGIMCIGDTWDPSCENKQRTVKNIERPNYHGPLCIEVDSCWGGDFRFIGRP